MTTDSDIDPNTKTRTAPWPVRRLFVEEPGRAALRAGVTGLSAINTIRSVMGVDLETLRPEPTVEGYTTPGGYSSKAAQKAAAKQKAMVSNDAEWSGDSFVQQSDALSRS